MAWLIAIVVTTWLIACGEAHREIAVVERALVFDNDDRRDYFEVTDTATHAALREAVVAVMPASLALDLAAQRADQLPTLGARINLCPNEPFGLQPSGAICSGVLLDWDLVLVARHCVQDVPLRDLAVVFGFYLEEPSRLAVTASDVYGIDVVVAAGDEDDDYSWLRLEQAVASPHRPAAVYTGSMALDLGTELTIMSSTAGVPIKIDQGARVFDSGLPERTHFVADSDTFQGSSGGGAFDAHLGLVGILESGGRDYVRTDAGCEVTRRVLTTDEMPTETYAYAYRAVQSLCEVYSSPLCEQTCGQPCRVPALAEAVDGCAVRPGRHGGSAATCLTALFMLCACRLKRRGRRCDARRTRRIRSVGDDLKSG
jgi:hypothetical protein